AVYVSTDLSCPHPSARGTGRRLHEGQAMRPRPESQEKVMQPAQAGIWIFRERIVRRHAQLKPTVAGQLGQPRGRMARQAVDALLPEGGVGGWALGVGRWCSIP